jgi:hypothetical protein
VDSLIQLVIYIVLFACAAYGLWWVCVKFGMPRPVLWIVGAVLLIVLLLFVARQFGVSDLHFRR